MEEDGPNTNTTIKDVISLLEAKPPALVAAEAVVRLHEMQADNALLKQYALIALLHASMLSLGFIVAVHDGGQECPRIVSSSVPDTADWSTLKTKRALTIQYRLAPHLPYSSLSSSPSAQCGRCSVITHVPATSSSTTSTAATTAAATTTTSTITTTTTLASTNPKPFGPASNLSAAGHINTAFSQEQDIGITVKYMYLTSQGAVVAACIDNANPVHAFVVRSNHMHRILAVHNSVNVVSYTPESVEHVVYGLRSAVATPIRSHISMRMGLGRIVRLDDMPPEIIALVCTFLDHRDLCCLAQVSHCFHRQASTNDLWRPLLHRTYPWLSAMSSSDDNNAQSCKEVFKMNHMRARRSRFLHVV